MKRVINWSASIVDTDSAAVAGVKVDLELFDLQSAAWKVAQTQAADAAGKLAGAVTLSVAALPYAPAARLVESDTSSVLAETPQIAYLTSKDALSLDFGSVIWLSPKQRIADKVARNLRTHDRIVAKNKVAGAQTLDVGRLKADLSAEIGKTFAAELAEKSRIIAERDMTLQAHARDIAGRDATISELRRRLDAQAREIERLSRPDIPGVSTPAQPPQAAVPVSMVDFAAGLGKDLDTAQVTLAAQSFSIDRFEVNARGLLSNGGRTIELPDKESRIDAGTLTDVTIGFRPATQADPGLEITVPDVLQLTESASRRVLASVGLRLEPGYGPRSLLPDSALGQAMVQTPRAGEKAARGARVLVVFANS